MRELSLHILDIAQNSIAAKATEIEIRVTISTVKDLLEIEIEDNGSGMTPEMAERVLDPFVTTRTTRKVGLGLPLFQAAAEQCEGGLSIDSTPGEGTLVKVSFKFSHIDRVPLGNIASTMVTLIQGNPDTDFLYLHRYDDEEYDLSTKVLREELDEVPLNHPMVLAFIAKDMKEGLEELMDGV